MKKLLVFLALVAVAACQEVYEEIAPSPVDIVEEDFSKVQVVDGNPDEVVDQVHVVDEVPREFENFDMDNIYEEVAPSPVQVVDGIPDEVVDQVHVVDEVPREFENFDMDNMNIDPGFMMPSIDADIEVLDPKFYDPEALDRDNLVQISDNPMARQLD